MNRKQRRANKEYKVNGKRPHPTQQQGVPIMDLPEIKCGFCNANVFYPIMQLRFCSALYSPNGKPTVVQVALGHICTVCGAINDFNAPDDILPLLPKRITCRPDMKHRDPCGPVPNEPNECRCGCSNEPGEEVFCQQWTSPVEESKIDLSGEEKDA